MSMLPLLAVTSFAAEHGPVSPDEALQNLLAGNQRYIDSRLTHPDQTAERRRELATGQHPFAAVLGCADSRVPPEVIFDQGLGDIFVVRVAGNVTSAEVLGSVEYAVEHLGITVVVVLGHEKCGAVQAATAGGHAEGHVAALIRDIEPAVHEARSQAGDVVHNAVVCNVRNSVRGIQAATPALKKLISEGKLKIIGARYDLETGKVFVLDEVQKL